MDPENSFLVNKWFTFAASAIIQGNAGLSYCFSIYAQDLKQSAGLNQTQLEGVGFASYLGTYTAVGAGWLYDYLSDKPLYGSRVVLWIGAVLCFIGHMGMYLCVTGVWQSTLPMLLLCSFIAGNASTWFDTTAIVTNVRNFPQHRGTVVGLLKSFLGFSASIYSSLYLSLTSPRLPHFLLFLAVAPSALCTFLAAAVNHVPYLEQSEVEGGGGGTSTAKRFFRTYSLVLVLAVYQLGSALVSAGQPLTMLSHRELSTGMLLLLSSVVFTAYKSGGYRSRPAASWFQRSPLLFPHTADTHPKSPLVAQQGVDSCNHSHSNSSHSHSSNSHSHNSSHSHRSINSNSIIISHSHTSSHHQQRISLDGPYLSPSEVLLVSDPVDDTRTPLLTSFQDSLHRAPLLTSSQDALQSSALHQPSAPHAPSTQQADMGEDMSMAAMMQTASFWLLFLQFGVGVGSGVVYLNNIAQISAALGGASGSEVVLVSLFSVSNAMGRVLMGCLPEFSLHTHSTGRPLFLALIAAATCLQCLLLARASQAALLFCSVLAGVTFGSHWSLVPAICSDLFGLHHFAGNYSVVQLAPAVGGYLLATRLAGWVYDHHAEAQGSTTTCTGTGCYHDTFLVLTVLCAFSTFTSLCLWWSTRRAYQRIAKLMRASSSGEY